MKRISGKIVVLILSVALILGIVITSALAATLLEGTNGNTIYMTMKYSDSNSDEESTITSVNANGVFYAFIKFSNNPTQKLEDSIEAYDIMVGYDQAKMTPTDYIPGEYTISSVCNLNFADGVVYTNWASLTGIADRFKNIQAEGCLGIIEFRAKQALTAEDLKGIKYLKQAQQPQGNELKKTVMGNGRSELFTVVSLPDLDVRMSKTTFDSKTPLGLIKQSITSVTFTDEDRSSKTLTGSEYTVTVKGAEELSQENNVIVVTYNGYSTEVELEISEKEYQKEDAKVTLDLGESVTKTYGDADFKVTAQVSNSYNSENYTWSVTGDAVTIASGSDTKAATLHISKTGLATVKLSYESEYSKGEAELKITVEKKDVTITASSGEIYVGQEIPPLSLTYSPTDMAGKPELAGITATAVDAGGEELKSTSTAGTYAVKFKKGSEIYGNDKQLTLENYEVTLKQGELKIKEKENANVTVTGSGDPYKYGGDPITLTANAEPVGSNGKYTWTVVAGGEVISITSDGGNTATASILKSGTATVKVTYDSVSSKGEGTIELNIGKAQIFFDTQADRKSIRVGGDDPVLSYIVTGLVGQDTIKDLGLTEADLEVEAYESENEDVPYADTGKAGSYVVRFTNKENIKIDSSNEKYELGGIKETGAFSVVVKDPVTVTLQGVPNTIKYGDSEFTITANVAETTEAGTYNWVSSSPDVIKLEGSGKSVTAKVLKAGSTTISVTFESEDCLGDATTDELRVAKVPLTITAGTYDMYEGSKLEAIDMKPTFDGFIAGENAAKYPEFSGLTVSAVKDDDVKITDADVEGPGEYVVKFFNGSDVVNELTSENYEVTLTTGKLTVKAKEDAKLTLSDAAETYTYGDGPISLSASVENEGENGGFKWTSSDSGVIALSSEEGSRVIATILKSGETTITATYDSASRKGTATITVKVEKAVVNVEIDSAIIKVNDELPTLSYTVTGLVGEDTLSDLIESNTLTVTTEADGKTAGEFEVKFDQEITEKTNDKYTLGTVTNGTLKVVDKERTEVTVSGKSEYSYSDTGAKLTAAATKAGETDKKYTWKSSDPSILEVTGESDGKTATLTFHKAGKATVTVTYESDTTFGVSSGVEITVKKAKLTVRPKSQSINVGDSVEAIEAEFDGLKTGDDKSVVVLASGELDRFVIIDRNGDTVESVNTSAAGEYTVKFADEVSFLDSDKYEITVETGNITVVAVSEDDDAGGDAGDDAVDDEGSTSTQPTVTVKYGAGGNITSREDGTSFTIKPNKGYVIDDVIVDGRSVGKVFTYHFNDMSKAHTIEAKFIELSSVKIPFIDIGSKDWFRDDVAYVYTMGLMKGTGDDKFSPDMVNSRGMIVTILYRLEGEPSVSATTYTDVAADQYYTDGVTWAAANGIVNGYGDGLFGPNDDLTREQLVTIMYRYAKYKGYDMGKADYSSFSDASKVSDFAADAMGWAIEHGIVNGVGNNTLAPQGTANRDQLAAILHRFCDELIK